MSTSSSITNNATLSFNRSNTITQGTDFASVIAGTGGLTQAGSGKVVLSGSNTFTGNVNVTAGTLEVSGTGTILQSTNASTVSVASGATVLLSGSANNALGWGGSGVAGTYEKWVVAGTINSTGGAAQTIPFGGIILNGGTLTSSSGNASYGSYYVNPSSGSITANGTGNLISAVDVGIGNGGAIATISTPLAGDTVTASAVFKDTGAAGPLSKTGAGSLIMSGANTYTGTTTISGGTLQIGAGGTTGSLSTSSSITNNATLSFNRSNTVAQGTDFAGVIAGTGAVTQSGSGTLVLSGANTYTGATTISAGTLQIGSGSTTGSLSPSSSITDNATLSFNRSNTLTQGTDFASVISGTGALTQAGSGTLILSGTNTYTGATLLSAGTLTVNGSVASSSLTTINGGTLTGTGAVGAIQLNSAGAINVGSGTLSTGNIAITDGQLVFSIGGTSNYGHLNTTGTVNLTNGGSGAQLVLNAINGYTAHLGDSFTLITNDLTDAISGHLAGLTEGQKIPNIFGSGLSGKITYVGGTGNDLVLMVVSPTPSVTSLAPTSGTHAGGTTVTLTGTNFTGATSVTFNGTAATSVSVVNDTTITAVTPVGTAGSASVVVTTPNGSNSANSLYTFVNNAPTLAAISKSGFEDTTVTFTAANFTSVFTDADNDTLSSITVVTLPATGTLKLSGSNVTASQVITAANLPNLTYVPAANENGAKTFTVTASDGSLSSTPATTVTMTLTAVNDVPSFALSTGTSAPAPSARFSAENNANDSSGNGNNGTAVNGVTYTTGAAGNGQAFRMNGTNQYVSVPHSTSVSFSSSFTISAWVRMSNRNTYYFIATKQPSSGGGSNYPGNYELRISPSGNLELLNQTGPGSLQSFASTSVVPLNTWTQVAVVFTAGSSVNFYINGTAAGTNSTSLNSLLTNTQPLLLGTRADNYSYFAGDMDEVYLVGSALSTSQVVGLYNSSLTVAEDSGAYSQSGFASSISPGPADESAQTVSFTVTNTNNSLFSVQPAVAANGTLTFTPAADANGSATISVTAVDNGGTANGGVDTSAAQTFNLTVTPVNDAPTNIALSSASIAENNSANATVGTLSTSDVDVGDTFTYTLVSGAGSTDNSSFTISGASLKLTPSANYESKNSYSVRVRTTDSGGLFFEKAFTISILDVNEPPVITSNGGGSTASISVAENTTTVTTVTATDPEVPSLQTLTFSKSGADAALFTLSSTTGVLTFTSAPNYELPLDAGADNVYNVTVTATDNGSLVLSVTQDLSITVTDVVEVQHDVTHPWTQSYGGVNAPTTRRNSDAKAVVVQQSAGSAVAAFATGYTTNAAGNKDIYTACYNPTSGAVVWEKIFNGTAASNDEGSALAVDGNGDVIVTGYTTNASGNTDVITVKYAHADGTQLWQKIYAGSGGGADVGTSVAVDVSNNVAVAGYGTRTATGLDVFGARYASDGTTTFEVLVDGGSNSTDLASSVALDSAGNLLVAGYVTKSGNAKDLLVLKLSAAAGASLWTSTVNGNSNGDDQAYSVAVDSSDAVFVTGTVHNTNYDLYAAKLSSAGAAQWSKQWNSSANSSDAGYAVTLDGQGNVIVVGTSYTVAGVQDGYVAKYSTSTGALLWDFRFDGPAAGNDILRSVGVDKENNLIAAGYSQNSNGTYDVASLKLLGVDGGLLWTQRHNGTGNLNDEGRAIAVTADGQAFVAGYATSTGGTTDFLVTSYSAAVPGTQTAQTITFANPGAQNAGVPLTLSASSSSGLTVHFAVVSGPAQIDESSNTLLNFTGSGSVTVRASQSGSATFAAATSVDQSFTVSQNAQTISFTLPANLASTVQWPLTGVASSGLPVSYSVQSGPGSISGGILSFSGAGTVVVRASQAGNARYLAAANVDATVTVDNHTPVVILDNIMENWRDRYAGSGAGEGNDLALQLSGNSAIAGFVGGYTTTATGKDLYLVKYLADGTLVWSVTSGTTGNDEAMTVKVDGSGDVLVAGYVTTATGQDVYVAKHSGSTGAKIWSYTYNGAGNSNDVGISLDLEGTTNVVVGGYVVGSGTSNDFFAAKLNQTTGAVVWTSVQNRSTTTSDVPAKVVVGTDGSVALAGISGSDAWTVKLAAATGAKVWQVIYNFANKPDAVRGLALDAANNVIIAAYSQGTNYDMYTAKYAALDGTLIWGKRYNSSFNSSDAPWDVVVDDNANVFVTGTSYRSASVPDGMTLKYSGLDGTLLWEGRFNGSSNGNDQNTSIALDGIGNPVVGGFTTNANGSTDVYLAKHNKAAGDLRWQKIFDGDNNKNDNVKKVKVDPNGNVWMTGSATGSSGRLEVLVLRDIPTF